MTFATSTIQGYCNFIGKLKETPNGRNVVNLLVSVPDKRNKEDNQSGTTFNVSIWDSQVDSVIRYIKKNQLITVTGTISIDNWYIGKHNEKKPIIKMDFASILDYGVTPEERIPWTDISPENVKTQAASTKQKVASTRK